MFTKEESDKIKKLINDFQKEAEEKGQEVSEKIVGDIRYYVADETDEVLAWIGAGLSDIIIQILKMGKD